MAVMSESGRYNIVTVLHVHVIRGREKQMEKMCAVQGQRCIIKLSKL